MALNDTAAVEVLLPDRWVAVHPEHRLEERKKHLRIATRRRRHRRNTCRGTAAAI
jgi:hypothetical protein